MSEYKEEPRLRTPAPLSPDPSKDGALSPGIWGQVSWSNASLNNAAGFLANPQGLGKGPIKKIKLTSFLGINNLLNERYFDNIRLNAFGKRYYEPAPDRNIYLGADISF